MHIGKEPGVKDCAKVNIFQPRQISLYLSYAIFLDPRRGKNRKEQKKALMG